MAPLRRRMSSSSHVRPTDRKSGHEPSRLSTSPETPSVLDPVLIVGPGLQSHVLRRSVRPGAASGSRDLQVAGGTSQPSAGSVLQMTHPFGGLQRALVVVKAGFCTQA